MSEDFVVLHHADIESHLQNVGLFAQQRVVVLRHTRSTSSSLLCLLSGYDHFYALGQKTKNEREAQNQRGSITEHVRCCCQHKDGHICCLHLNATDLLRLFDHKFLHSDSPEIVLNVRFVGLQVLR